VLDLGSGGYFGHAIAGLGDYDGDGFVEIAVSEYVRDSPGLSNDGRIHIIDIDSTGVPQAAFQVMSGTANFTTLLSDDNFGVSLANLGDWNGDGAPELGVGALKDADGQAENGAAYILWLSPPAVANTHATGVRRWHSCALDCLGPTVRLARLQLDHGWALNAAS
jgi:hypothetical protein